MQFDLIGFISQVGFPIAVSVYSLLVLNRTVGRMVEIMTKIATKLDIDVRLYEEEDKRVS